MLWRSETFLAARRGGGKDAGNERKLQEQPKGTGMRKTGTNLKRELRGDGRGTYSTTGISGGFGEKWRTKKVSDLKEV